MSIPFLWHGIKFENACTCFVYVCVCSYTFYDDLYVPVVRGCDSTNVGVCQSTADPDKFEGAIQLAHESNPCILPWSNLQLNGFRVWELTETLSKTPFKLILISTPNRGSLLNTFADRGETERALLLPFGISNLLLRWSLNRIASIESLIVDSKKS
jgi:hypothetical protein